MPVPRPHPRSNRARRLKLTALTICVVLAIIGALLGLRSPMLHQYEYQEDLYLSLNGSASMFVSGSLPALAALHGMDVPTDPTRPIDRAAIMQLFGAPGIEVSAIRSWRRWGRRFIMVRLDTTDVRRLPASRPFAHAAFEFAQTKSGFRLAEHLGASANRAVGDVGWSGRELVGFRWHLPSRVDRYNTPQENYLRGNILVWEQPLKTRLAGTPLTMWVEMQPESILSGALWLFAVSALSALIAVALLLWWVVRKGKPPVASARQ